MQQSSANPPIPPLPTVTNQQTDDCLWRVTRECCLCRCVPYNNTNRVDQRPRRRRRRLAKELMALPLLACLGTATSITRYSVSVSVFGAPKNAILDCANSVSDGRRTKPSIRPFVCLSVQPNMILLLTRVAITFGQRSSTINVITNK